ncbi:MAG: GntR family transcriptional regulator [Sporichthyaceae bacterium]
MPEIEQVLPKYLQIAGYIRDQIVRGDLKPGDEVPSEREIAASWSVARPTATKALEALRVQGFVESVQGSGTYVRARGASSAPRARERYDRAREHGGMYGENETMRLLSAEMVTAPDYVVDALGLPADGSAIRRTRLITSSVDGPVELATSWFSADLAEVAPGLLELKGLRGGTAKYIAEVTDLDPSYARDQVMARLATAEERRHLELPRPAAVLVHWLILSGPDDRPVEFDEGVYPQARWAMRQDYVLPAR